MRAYNLVNTCIIIDFVQRSSSVKLMRFLYMKIIINLREELVRVHLSRAKLLFDFDI